MKTVLLDENLDKRLKNYFSVEFDVTSVPDLGWQSKKNGELLSAMQDEGIDILLTSFPAESLVVFGNRSRCNCI